MTTAYTVERSDAKKVFLKTTLTRTITLDKQRTLLGSNHFPCITNLYVFKHHLHLTVLTLCQPLGTIVGHVACDLAAGNPLPTRTRKDVPFFLVGSVLCTPR